MIVPPKLREAVPDGCSVIVSDEPYLHMAYLSKVYAQPFHDDTAPQAQIGEGCRISERAVIERGSVIGADTTIMANVSIGVHVKIGKNVTIYPNVTIYQYCEIGDNVIIHAGTVIGSDGYGFAHTKDGEHVKIYQNGNVVIEDDVEIGANCAIDCAVFGSTRIKKGAKLDNLIQIAHNCEVGEYSLMAAQVGLAGSTHLGRNVVMGGQSASAGHLRIAPFTTIAGKCGVTNDIKEPGKTYAGFPHKEHKLWLKLQAKLARLVKK